MTLKRIINLNLLKVIKGVCQDIHISFGDIFYLRLNEIRNK